MLKKKAGYTQKVCYTHTSIYLCKLPTLPLLTKLYICIWLNTHL